MEVKETHTDLSVCNSRFVTLIIHYVHKYKMYEIQKTTKHNLCCITAYKKTDDPAL